MNGTKILLTLCAVLVVSGCVVELLVEKTSAAADSAVGGTMQHVIVYGEPDISAGWPANHGVWSWDDGEIVVGFSHGTYELRNGHNVKEDTPTFAVLARSTDGGETWAMEDPRDFAGDGKPAPTSDPPGGIDFTHPDFVMTVKNHILRGTLGDGESFYYSCDRGRTWCGAYHFGDLMKHPKLAGHEFTGRTDYLVNGPDDCHVWLSSREKNAQGSIRSDKTFLARSTDGGKSFKIISWVVDLEDPYRAVMPSSVRCSESKLVSALRRRMFPDEVNWIDVYVSTDNGSSWSFLSKVGDTGKQNGNPPALVRLQDGRLCCVYGNRTKNIMIARFSEDEGGSWGPELVLRDDYQTDSFDDRDLGYPRLVQRPDGKLVAIYYWATKDRPQLHIAATIWDPGR